MTSDLVQLRRDDVATPAGESAASATWKEPKKIVGIISFMNAAGAQEAILRLMRQLRARGHKTEVWFLYEQIPCYRGEEGVRVLISKPHISTLEYFRLLFRIASMLRKERPDAVVGFLPLGNVIGLSAAMLAGVKTRVASQRSPGNTFFSAMRRLDRILGSLGIYKDIVCVSDAVRASFSSYPRAYRSKLRVVHNGIEWSGSKLSKHEARASFGLASDMPLFVATGRFVQQKNYDWMIRQVAATEGVRLAIAGEGPLRADCEALAAELGAAGRIHFAGNLTRGRVVDLLRAADAFIQTSLFEGQSNSILEAMHEGLPIVCSDISMQRETLCDEDGEPAALLVPLDSAERWQGAIARIRDDADYARALGMLARALVERRFGLKRMIDGFERVLTGTETAP